MTTIAFDGRYIACDSRLSCDGHIATDTHKKFFEKENEIVFWSGALCQAEEMVSAYISGSDFERDPETFLFVFERATRLVYQVSCKNKKFNKDKIDWIDASGSGACYAIGAMESGKSAVEAVKIAKKRDMATGGIIHCLDTHTGKFIKVKQ